MAYTATAQIANAEAELKALQGNLQAIPADSPSATAPLAACLQVAEHLLAGKIALARGDKKMAIELLRKGVEAEDAVGYNEPPTGICQFVNGSAVCCSQAAITRKLKKPSGLSWRNIRATGAHCSGCLKA